MKEMFRSHPAAVTGGIALVLFLFIAPIFPVIATMTILGLVALGQFLAGRISWKRKSGLGIAMAVIHYVVGALLTFLFITGIFSPIPSQKTYYQITTPWAGVQSGELG